jgi:hypothetical protein
MGSTLTAPLNLTCTKNGSRDWDLMADSIRHATLRFENMFGSLATGETVEGRWTFKRNGFLNTWLSARHAGGENDIATMRRKGWHAAELTLLSGPTFSWRRTKRAKGEYGLYDIRDRLIISATFKRKLFSAQGVASLEPAAQKIPEAPMLMLLCWYWLVLRDMDDSASVSMIAAMG